MIQSAGLGGVVQIVQRELHPKEDEEEEEEERKRRNMNMFQPSARHVSSNKQSPRELSKNKHSTGIKKGNNMKGIKRYSQ